MENFSLLPLILLLLSISPLAAGARPPSVRCVGGGSYAANSAYEANLRRLAAVLPAAVSASRRSYTYRAVGFWPNRLQASSRCRHRDGDGSVQSSIVTCNDGACYGNDDSSPSSYSSCAACIAGAFREVEAACPYHRDAFFSDSNCTLQLSEVHILGTDGIYDRSMLKQALGSGFIFQAIGFAWLFFLLLQEWRGQKRGTSMRPTPLP